MKEHFRPANETCLCCGGGHVLDLCPQLGKRAHKEKIGFLKENCVCFGCLRIGHISRVCKKRISCIKCGLRHPTILHIPSKEKEKDFEQAERKSEVLVDNTLIASALTGAGDHDCKLPIVPVQVKSKKGNKIVTTYAFLDQGSTAVFCIASTLRRCSVSMLRLYSAQRL